MTKTAFVGLPSLIAFVALTILESRVGAQVLSHQKISSTEGRFLGILDDEDNFGRSVVSPGDVDGDGIADLAVGSLLDDDGGSDVGAVWILFLERDGTVRGHQKISATDGGFSGSLDDNDRFCVSLAAVGDLDGDCVVDLAVGAFLDDDGGTDHGAVWILLLNADGTVKSHRKISETQGGFGGVLNDVDGLGRGVTCLGDVDGNGVVDLAVGAPGTDDGGPGRGAVWILFLDTDLSVLFEQKISSTDGQFTGRLDDSDEFGVAVAGLGDLNGDGTPDLAVSAPGDDDGGLRRGAVWVLFLESDGSVEAYQKISQTEGCFLGALTDLDLFGVSLASLGDLSGDGNTDLAVGVRRDDDGGNDVGAVWLVFLNPDGTVNAYQKLSATEGGFTGMLDNVDEFGSSIASLGDLDQDGRNDLVVGAMRDDDGGLDLCADRGAVWLLFLDTPGFLGTVNQGGGEITDVLFVNARVGTVCVPTSTPLTVSHDSALMGPALGAYVLYAWLGPPRNCALLTVGPSRLGCFVNPTPFHGDSPQPFLCLRGSLPAIVCSGVSEMPAPPRTPWAVTKGGGLEQPITLTLQGLVEDDGSANLTHFSVTNAVVVEIE